MTNIRDEEGKLKRKMLRYLGTESSSAYLKMVSAIARRNQIQQLQKQKELALSQRRQNTRSNRAINTPPTKSIALLNQQLQHLLQRFERLEGEFELLKNQQMRDRSQ